MKAIAVALALLTLPLAAHAGTVDHLMRCADEPTCQADPVIGKYYTPPSADGPGGWRGDVAIPNVRVYAVTGTQTVTDPNSGQTYQQEVRSYFPGWFIVIALPALDPPLRDVANGGCRLIADRDAANAGSANFIRYTAADVTPADLATAHVEPTFAGSQYPFAN